MVANLWEAVYDESTKKANKDFEGFIQVCLMAGEKKETLISVLKNAKNITAFVPTNDAFAEFLGAVKKSGKTLTPELVFEVVAYHVVKGLFCRNDLKNAMNDGIPMFLETFSPNPQKLGIGPWREGNVWHIMLDNAEIQGAAINLADQTAFRIDSVLLPPIQKLNMLGDAMARNCKFDEEIAYETHKQKRMKK
jgi:uncharacterized surface protein with fasciclin (FAS1) repeats